MAVYLNFGVMELRRSCFFSILTVEICGSEDYEKAMSESGDLLKIRGPL
jgi:hypothetical protein